MDVTRRRITKIAREVGKFTTRTLRADGIGTGELDFLHVVRKNPGVTQAGVCQILGMDKGAAARRVVALEAKGYLTREPNPDDRRSRLLYATDKAQALKSSKAHIEACFYEWLLEALDEEQRIQFSGLLDILYERCKAESKADFPTMGELVKAD